MPLSGGLATGIVSILFALSRGAQSHITSTVLTEHNAAQQRRTVHGSRRPQLRTSRLEEILDRVEFVLLDDRLHRNINDIFRRLLNTFPFAADIETKSPDVGCTR